jgi:NADH-quinone oxidoreductase subunit N
MHSVNFLSPFISGVFAVLAIFIGVFLKERAGKIFSIATCVLGIFVSFAPFYFLLPQSTELNTPSPILFTGWLSQILLASVTISAIILMANDKSSDISRFENYPLLLLSFCGILFSLFSENIIGIYLGLELASITGYILAGLGKTNPRSGEASMKYFLMGAVSSGFMIYGISLVYGFSGGNFDFTIAEPSTLQINEAGLTIGFLLFIFGLLFKITCFPFHAWAPDVYSGMNSASLSFISLAPKIQGFFVLYKVVVLMVASIPFAMEVVVLILTILSGISMMIGAIGALRQTELKKILAYSGISHMGYILSVFSVNQDIALSFNILYYFLIYTFINMGIFSVIACLKQNPAYKGNINDIKGLSKSNPILAFIIAILMFSNAGVPPLAGFFIKYSIFARLIANESYILPIIGVISSVIASFYYLKIVKTVYFDERESRFIPGSKNKINIFIKLLLVICVAVNILFIYV